VPVRVWLVLDQRLAATTLELAAHHRLRGADAVYAAAAQHERSVLITLDKQQLTRLPPTFKTLQPAEALAQMAL